jgi:hypothetical protein
MDARNPSTTLALLKVTVTTPTFLLIHGYSAI